MKIGDFINNLDLKMLKDITENASSEEIEKIKQTTKAVSFLVDMAVETIDAPSILKCKMPLYEIGQFSCQVLANSSAISVFKYSCRTDNPEAYINTFKHFFEIVLMSLTGKQS